MEIFIIILVCLEIFLLIVLFLVFANGRRIRKEIDQLENCVDTKRTDIYEVDNLSKLPGPVQRYFKNVLKDGQRCINIARIRQSGLIRLKENQKWMQLKAVQYFNAQSPAFIWVASAKSSPFFWISSIDKYFNSRANMIVRLFSLFTMAKAAGEEMNISALTRYIAEMPWFPTSLLPSKNLSWEPIDEKSAAAKIKNGNAMAKVTFYFNDAAEIVRVTTEDRSMFSGGKYCKEKWTGYFKKYKEINELRIPTEVEAEWNLKNGDFKYFKASLEKIEYS